MIAMMEQGTDSESEQLQKNRKMIMMMEEKQNSEELQSSSRKRKSSTSMTSPKSIDIKSKKLKQVCNDSKQKPQTLIAERASLQKLMCQKQECLRQLRLVKLYRTKNNLSELQELIDKWREACQQSLTELQERMPEPKPSINELIQLWQLDQDLLQYKTDEESF